MIRPLSLSLFLALAAATDLGAQTVRIAAQAIAAWERVDHTPEAKAGSEVRVVQPMAMVHAAWGPVLRARATLDLEGLTMPGGELMPGAWGEGFVDRRHPHTYAHELILEAATTMRCGLGPARCRLGGFVGKGFVPFGSDDPATRPFVRYPINHHLAQILERAVIGAQLGAGPVLVEAALFNGDEPERPGQWPRIGGRFGDSWSVRATLTPKAGVEVAGSAAKVRSPEHRPGAGADQDKLHVGIRVDRPLGAGRLRALGEWARTEELGGFFVFRSWLAEADWTRGRFNGHYRFESTDRPEEERIGPYRSLRPHLENSILGITRWTTHSIGGSVRLGGFGSRGVASAIGEVTGGRITAPRPGIFDVRATYGADGFVSLTFGVRLAWSAPAHAMGRYAAAAPSDPHH